MELGAQQLHLLSGESWLILSTLTSQLLRVARCFDPSFARSSMNEQIVRGLAHIVPIAHMVDDLLVEQKAYVEAAAAAGPVNRNDVAEFTQQVILHPRPFPHRPCTPQLHPKIALI